MATENYTLGRGEVYFAPFADQDAKTLAPGGGFRFLGNAPSFGLNIQAQKYEHYRSTGGIKEKDLSVILQVNRTATVTLEDISVENLALFFMGSTEVVTAAAQTDLSETFTLDFAGQEFQLGLSATNPSGLRSISGIAITAGTDGTGAPLVAGVDYVADTDRGTITTLSSTTVAVGSKFTAKYGTGAADRKTVVSGNTQIYGALRFKSYPAVGKPIDYFMPNVTLSSNGDFNLIADEIQSLPFTIDVQALGSLAAIYADGLPYAPTGG